MSDSLPPMDRSLPGSSVHGVVQARVLEWGAIAFSAPGTGSPPPHGAELDLPKEVTGGGRKHFWNILSQIPAMSRDYDQGRFHFRNFEKKKYLLQSLSMS